MITFDYLSKTDSEIHDLVIQENRRQRDKVRLIPSENYVSQAVLEASGSVLTNKYSEGYPKKRYYRGQTYIDKVEIIARDRAKALFGADHANVQPYSGSPANFAVYFSFLKPGDTVMGMSLPHGGHLTHGWNVSVTGSYFNPVYYTVNPETHRLDYNEIRRQAREHRPKLLFAGATAYPRTIDFAAFRQVADEVGAIFCADIAHISGLVVTGAHPSPVPHADVVSTTTHKTLRGPRGGMLLCRADHADTIDKAVFPGLQGGPHNHTTAAIAVALKEAATEEFRAYGHQVVKNAAALAEALLGEGFSLITGGTDNHLILIDVTTKGATGRKAAAALDRAGIVTNANTIPFDQRKPFDPSGIRIGTPAVTTRGMKEGEMKQIARWMGQVMEHLKDKDWQKEKAKEVAEFCRQFPAPGTVIP